MSRFQNQPKNTVSPNEAARILGVTGEAVKQWIYAGQLAATKLPNGYYRIKHGYLAVYLAQRQTAHQVLVLACVNSAATAILAAFAKDLNLAFSTVTDTVAALKQFKAQAPNLLVVDLDGFADGWKLIRRVRDSVRYGSPKILLLSRKALLDRENDLAVRLGVNGCVDEAKALAAEVQQLLRCSPRLRPPADI